MKALIVAGGEKPSAELLIDAAKDAEIIIGADRGCEYLFQADLKPNYIVGDFDSADKDIIDSLEALGAVKISYNCEKDSTDSDIALELAIEKGAEEIAHIDLIDEDIHKNIIEILFQFECNFFLCHIFNSFSFYYFYNI